MSKEVMQLALDALESVRASVKNLDMYESNTPGVDATPFDLTVEAIAALSAELARLACWCPTCRPFSLVMPDMRFIVCPDCGNKRCPKAFNHALACTASNEPGQVGSSYQKVPVDTNPPKADMSGEEWRKLNKKWEETASSWRG